MRKHIFKKRFCFLLFSCIFALISCYNSPLSYLKIGIEDSESSTESFENHDTSLFSFSSDFSEVESSSPNAMQIAERVSEGVKPTAEQLNNAITYKRIIIFGVDGAGGAFEKATCPNFDRIFSSGNVNYHGVSQYKTISGENWCSMMYGVTAQTHNRTNNIISETEHNDPSMPSVFKICTDYNPDMTFYSAVNWTPINYGLFENMDTLTKYSPRTIYPDLDSYKIDLKVFESAKERIRNFNDSICFFHFDYVDAVGHIYGSASEQYLNAISFVDTLMGGIFDVCVESNKFESTLFVCVSDHGHSLVGGHGDESEEEKTVTLAVCGDRGNIIKGSSEKYVTHDLASIILYAFGISQPNHFEGGVPKNLFNTLR